MKTLPHLNQHTFGPESLIAKLENSSISLHKSNYEQIGWPFRQQQQLNKQEEERKVYPMFQRVVLLIYVVCIDEAFLSNYGNDSLDANVDY
ncbi:hypothetical protein DERF_002709 [Dermatophagoides farinae]|uniref:Uncharacterized protein n=1 Tax=Dermatophagoides farinae TaxID=6954 RepID=A0A922IEV5_DERFA|nr:hypothetical protein DERF_002709 [Dermatophagoides farinae]